MSDFLLDQPARLACCRIRERKTSLEMPIPPDLAKDFEYSSVSIERQTPVPVVSPNGPSPLMPVVICENIVLRNIASKSCAVDFALACATGDTLASAAVNSVSGWLLTCGRAASANEFITSPRCRLRWRPRP